MGETQTELAAASGRRRGFATLVEIQARDAVIGRSGIQPARPERIVIITFDTVTPLSANFRKPSAEFRGTKGGL
jgi:hypothetical protein